jgi:hypothetical protein
MPILPQRAIGGLSIRSQYLPSRIRRRENNDYAPNQTESSSELGRAVRAGFLGADDMLLPGAVVEAYRRGRRRVGGR